MHRSKPVTAARAFRDDSSLGDDSSKTDMLRQIDTHCSTGCDFGGFCLLKIFVLFLHFYLFIFFYPKNSLSLYFGNMEMRSEERRKS